MPREVSSCACMANMVSSATDTAKATDEFLKMFIDSLVSGGMMMRNAIGRMHVAVGLRKVVKPIAMPA
jgi:hypothetical protein